MMETDIERREALDAAAGGDEKRRYVRSVFSEIAPRYDLLNHLLSFNVDRRWRRRAIEALRWERDPNGVYLDVCAGTLDVSAELARRPGFRGTVLAADFAEPMLRRGLAKVKGSAVRPVVGDALQLPVADRRVAGAIVAFGARNFHDLDAGLAELHRALARGARLVILDFSCPSIAPVRAIYNAYFHGVLPRVGALISGHRTAYRYLPESVANFPGAVELARRMEHAGFARVEHRTLTMGIAAIHWGERAA